MDRLKWADLEAKDLERLDDQPPQPFAGDFYRQPNFSRSVSFGISNVDTYMAGDFYRDPEVTRSADRGLLETYKYTEGVKRFESGDEQEFGALKPGDIKALTFLRGKLNDSEPYKSSGADGGEFTPADKPPPAPTDKFWEYQATKVQVSSPGLEGYQVGNLLLSFLRNDVEADILKKRTPNDHDHKEQKFSVKALVWMQRISCTMKIHVFKEEVDNTFSVEFQRRSGDGIAFMKAYDRACLYLKNCTGEPQESTIEACDFSIDDPLAMPTEAEINPLLDMAAMEHMPSLQADSATALAGLAEDDKRAPLLCTDKAFGQIKNLLKCNQTPIAYPVARTLSSLADHADAAQHFVEQGILEDCLDKVKEHTTSALVQKHLVQTLCCAVTRATPILSEKAVKNLLVGLSAAVKKGPVSDGYETGKEKEDWVQAFGARDWVRDRSREIGYETGKEKEDWVQAFIRDLQETKSKLLGAASSVMMSP